MCDDRIRGIDDVGYEDDWHTCVDCGRRIIHEDDQIDEVVQHARNCEFRREWPHCCRCDELITDEPTIDSDGRPYCSEMCFLLMQEPVEEV